MKLAFLSSLLLVGCHSSHELECGEGAPLAVTLDVTVLDSSTHTPIEMPSFTLDGADQSAGCDDLDAGRCPEWHIDLDFDLAAGTHTLSVSAVDYAPTDVTLTATSDDGKGPCGDTALSSITPSHVTVTLSP